MKRFLAAIAIVIGLTTAAQAQYPYHHQFGDTSFVTTSGYGRASVVFKTGFSDVACAGGICLVPTEGGGYGIQNGFGNGVAIIPQSTAFFALSNPQVFQFRVREFNQIPGTNAIITTDSYGNQIEVINAGIGGQGTLRSRGQTLYAR